MTREARQRRGAARARAPAARATELRVVAGRHDRRHLGRPRPRRAPPARRSDRIERRAQRHRQHPRPPVARLGGLRRRPRDHDARPGSDVAAELGGAGDDVRRGRSTWRSSTPARSARRLVAGPLRRARALDLEREQRRAPSASPAATGRRRRARGSELADDGVGDPQLDGADLAAPRRAASPPRPATRQPRRARRSSGRSAPRWRRAPAAARATAGSPPPTRSPPRAPPATLAVRARIGAGGSGGRIRSRSCRLRPTGGSDSTAGSAIRWRPRAASDPDCQPNSVVSRPSSRRS